MSSKSKFENSIRLFQHIKADLSKKGDLGIVAESSKGTQRIMFQVRLFVNCTICIPFLFNVLSLLLKPAPLTVAAVFAKLKEIGEMTGHSSMNKKTEKIQSMLVACRQSESRFLIRFASLKQSY